MPTRMHPFFTYRSASRAALLLFAVLAYPLPPLPAQQEAPQGGAAIAAPSIREIVAHRGSSADRPENTLAAYERAIEAGATAIEVDVRMSLDGQLFSLHDDTLDRTTSGKGPAEHRTLAELKALDAGAWFGNTWRGERIPTLREICEMTNGRVDLFLDLKDGDEKYRAAVVRDLTRHGDPRRTILGIRSVDAARYFRQYLPGSRLVGLIPRPEDIESFLEAGVKTIRLWPHWLNPAEGGPSAGDKLVERIRAGNAEILISAGKGTPAETEAVLRAKPELLFTDDPAALLETLKQPKQ